MTISITHDLRRMDPTQQTSIIVNLTNPAHLQNLFAARRGKLAYRAVQRREISAKWTFISLPRLRIIPPEVTLIRTGDMDFKIQVFLMPFNLNAPA